MSTKQRINTATTDSITYVECPRDAMQGWNRPIATKTKVRYLKALLKVGFQVLDFGSFVSPKAIPQMADTAQVLEQLDFSSLQTPTRLLAIVANVRGAREAAGFKEIYYLGFPFSVSETFQLRNANSSRQESLERVTTIQQLCLEEGKELVIYLSMGFGNPYGDPYSLDILCEWADQMVTLGVKTISLADTVGLATPDQIQTALEVLIERYPETTFGVHLHATRQNSEAKIQAALAAGCRRFDGALKGIGGCPMAQDRLVGNMDTELTVQYMQAMGYSFNYDPAALSTAAAMAGEVFLQ